MLQFLVGFVLAVVVAFVARRAHSLSRGGAYAAAVVGTVVFGIGGLPWAILLLAFFISSSALSRAFKKRKAGLEEILGLRVDHFAYPYGRYNEATIRILRSAGFACACTTNAGLVDKYSDRFQLPRLTVGDWGGEEFARRLSDWYGSETRRAFEAARAAASAGSASRSSSVLSYVPSSRIIISRPNSSAGPRIIVTVAAS